MRPARQVRTFPSLPRQATPPMPRGVPVRRSVLERKLGAAAVRLLSAWQTCASIRTGETFAPLRTAAAAARLTEAQAWRAARRLREAGLIVSLGVERRGPSVLFYRHVRGSTAERPWGPSKHVDVPEATRRWLIAARDANTWGGHRVKVAPPRVKPVPAAQSVVAAPVRPAVERPAVQEARRHNPPNVVVDDDADVGISVNTEKTWGQTTEEILAQMARDRERKERAILAESVVPAPGTLAGDPRVPHPPVLKKGQDPVFQARLLAAAYVGACELGLGMKCPLFKGKGAVTKSKHYDYLVEAAQHLLEERVSPVQWAIWSAFCWRDFRWPLEAQAMQDRAAKRARSGAPPSKSKPKRKKLHKLSLPPVRFVFSPDRIHKHIGWFNSEGYSYCCYNADLPAYKRLVENRQRAVTDIVRTTEDPDSVVARYFPEGYEAAIERSRIECERMRAGLKQRIEDGEFIWTKI